MTTHYFSLLLLIDFVSNLVVQQILVTFVVLFFCCLLFQRLCFLECDVIYGVYKVINI